MKMSIPDKISFKFFVLILSGLIILCFYLFISMHKNRDVTSYENNKKIESIRKYVNSISTDFLNDVGALAKKENLTTWGCGPSSYALASLINKKFFDNKLTVHVLYDNEPEEITERFGFVQFKEGDENSVIDHAWIEIYMKNKLIYIDPTVAKYGKVKEIAFEIFDVGQPDIKKILKEKYGIIDNRLSLVMAKIYNNIPVDQPPYKGMALDQDSLPQYEKILKVRNTVSLGREPITWKNWIEYLVTKYNNY